MAEHPSGCNTWVAEKASDSAPAESPTSPLLNIGTAAHLSAVRVVQGITMTLHLAEDNVELCTELAVAASSPYFAKPAAERTRSNSLAHLPLPTRRRHGSRRPMPSFRCVLPPPTPRNKQRSHRTTPVLRSHALSPSSMLTYSTVPPFRTVTVVMTLSSRTRTLTFLPKWRLAPGTSRSGSEPKGRSAHCEKPS